MSDFLSIATAFFHACESGAGWSVCEAYVEPEAIFNAQSEPLVEMKSVAEYCDWMKENTVSVFPNCRYDLHATGFDDNTNTAMFFGTFHATHEGGPIPATGQETHSQYVYILDMSPAGKVQRMVKVWNSSWALRELGWI